jgi:hypothetical protein
MRGWAGGRWIVYSISVERQRIGMLCESARRTTVVEHLRGENARREGGRQVLVAIFMWR